MADDRNTETETSELLWEAKTKQAGILKRRATHTARQVDTENARDSFFDMNDGLHRSSEVVEDMFREVAEMLDESSSVLPAQRGFNDSEALALAVILPDDDEVFEPATFVPDDEDNGEDEEILVLVLADESD